MVLYRQHRLLYFFLLFSGACISCGKTKLSGGIPDENTLVLTNSNIRLINISQRDLPIVVNNVVLAMQYVNDFEEEKISAIGKQLFPDGVWKNSTSFSIPTVVLDKTGGAYISIPSTNSAKFKDTLIQNDPVAPRDYYLLPAGKIATFPRNNTPPADPRNFKVRIVNLGDPNSEFNVGGPVSLTYANGSGVDARLNGIINGSSSDYAEVPYGAYQFKLFAGAGVSPDYRRQLVTDNIVPAFNKCIPGTLPQEGFMPPVATFKPGGVYTVMVIPSFFNYDVSCNGGSSIRETHYANAYQIITDLDPGPNLSYARINAINTIPGKKIIVKDNGSILGEGALNFIGDQFTTRAVPAVYHTVVQGNHTIQAQDEYGNILAELNMQLYPFDNITFWVRNDASGKAEIVFTPNDMTNTIYRSNLDSGSPPDDGTNGEIRRRRFTYAWQSRFMNFCNAKPSIAFSNDGQLFLPATNAADTLRRKSAYTNLAPGVAPYKNGSVIYLLGNISLYNEDGTPNQGSNAEFSFFPRKIWINDNANGEIPGSLLTDITPITSAITFTANPLMYSTTYTVPPAENGIYTMALVGGEAGVQPKIVVIKHNK